MYANFITDTCLIGLHIAALEMENEFKNRQEKEIAKKYVKPSLILDVLMGSYGSIAALIFEKSIPELIKEARSGHEESFFNLLQIDRTIVECEWAQKMIRKAQLTANEHFFKKMAKAISTSPLENVKEYTTLRIVLLVFWRFGLRKLENNELIELLEECGIKFQDDPEAFRRFVNRLIGRDVKANPVPITFF